MCNRTRKLDSTISVKQLTAHPKIPLKNHLLVYHLYPYEYSLRVCIIFKCNVQANNEWLSILDK